MRLEEPPSLEQRACAHRWQVTTSLRTPLHRWPTRRYVRCRQCGMRVHTTELLDQDTLAAEWLERLATQQS
jgi:hypothetical protein